MLTGLYIGLYVAGVVLTLVIERHRGWFDYPDPDNELVSPMAFLAALYLWLVILPFVLPGAMADLARWVRKRKPRARPPAKPQAHRPLVLCDDCRKAMPHKGPMA